MPSVTPDGELLALDKVHYQARGPEEQIQDGPNKDEVRLDRRYVHDNIVCIERNTMLNR
jgi:hypothetical protein